MDFSMEDVEGRHVLLDIQEPFFSRVLDLGEAALLEATEGFERARAAGDDDAMEWLSEDARDAFGFVQESAELAMVATYHWVERTLKRELSRLLRARHKPDGGVAKMNYPQLETTFDTEGIVLANLASGVIVTKTLRLFANSWKHNAESVGDPLRVDLGVPPDCPGHFSVVEVRDAMGQKVGIGAGHTGADIVRAFVPRVHEFLKAVVSAVG